MTFPELEKIPHSLSDVPMSSCRVAQIQQMRLWSLPIILRCMAESSLLPTRKFWKSSTALASRVVGKPGIPPSHMRPWNMAEKAG